MKYRIEVFKKELFNPVGRNNFEVQNGGKAMISTIQKHEEGVYEGEKLQRRLDYARYLLTQTFEPMGKIAADCGWRSENDFSKVFQNLVGVSPSFYRHWHQN